ncbi:Protein tipE [Gryllus bimaculatus]|nr:Protein tipE [Gryllus bimaculatus]
MADVEEEIIPQTLKQKLLFYTTAFFILLGTFSLFAFLFLVPFVIDPAFTTIFMQFDTHPAWCVTTESETLVGASNCTWSSCREGCTKELFRCTQVRVNYKLVPPPALPASPSPSPSASDSPAPTALALAAAGAAARGEEEAGEEGDNATDDGAGAGWGTSRRAGATPRSTRAVTPATTPAARAPRAIREYDYLSEDILKEEEEEAAADNLLEELQLERGLQGNDSEWFYVGAKLYPNVKGCGYPPMLECSVFFDLYGSVGSNFSCYYSKVDPGLVISELDMHQVYMNLVYAMAIPIPSFIVSVIYLTFAYFVIYNEDEEGQEGLVGTDAGDGDGDGTLQRRRRDLADCQSPT